MPYKSSTEKGFSIKSLLIFILLIALGAGTWYLYQAQTQDKDNTQKFITENVRRGNIVYSVNASGMIYPKKIVKVGAQVTGEISKLTVQVGDEVKEGDLIAEIDARTQENAKQTAVAQLASHQAALKTAKANLATAQQAYARANKLYQKGAGTQAEQQSSYNDFIRAQNAVKEAEANIRQSQLTIENANVNLGYTKVNAPISGTVIAVAVEEGQSENAAQSSPTLVTLAQTDVMTIKAEIAEADIAVMRVGLPVSFTLLGKNSETYHANLARIDPAPKEISDNNTLTANTAIYYYGHIDIPNANHKLRYGMTANISIEVAKAENVLLIPMTAIQTNNNQSSVTVLVNGQPQTRPITVGLEDGVNAEVKNGLNEGEIVVISSEGNNDNPFGKRRGFF
ncbi:efflux RND transporter periplasmic adaptor subunit [Suttonella ornithocola]|uniref:Macrolide-specific efflux protein macA n=1 Tax=Suttonella ornithocola TaxID=279832 RepID=A0A380N0W4_9GAMM|nr:efflux RND transporter periplasmic adaptor subunit [Suttonella ornithocola]SUO97397.1 Macrolide-specific efflux protein macA precursor [Suttonella ornithocola]